MIIFFTTSKTSARTQNHACMIPERARHLAVAAALTCLSILAPLQPTRAAESMTTPDGQLAAGWNELAYQIAFAEDEFLTFKGHRALALMHLAMHDALNTIDPEYGRYVYAGPRSDADPVAAAAQAAYEVLLSQYPNARTKLETALASSLEQGAMSPAKRTGIELGKATAAATLARRNDDGFDAKGTYAFVTAPGQYQTTPPWDGFVAQPGFRTAKPFALISGHQFRPSAPPALSSAAYADAFDEVKAYGSTASRVRDPDQTGYAVWWMEFSEGSVNRLARRLVKERGIGLWEANRMFAQMNVALFDVYVAVWDSKYTYNHWRPSTAIHEAADDGNAGTLPQLGWQPLRPAPPFPEYVSAHAAGCAAAFAVLAHSFPDTRSFRMETITAPAQMPTRSFTSFRQAANECADSRVRLGWHFRYSVNEGMALGSRIASHVLETFLIGIR
jgi:hypothetical protein